MGDSANGPLAGVSILLVEDHEDTRELFTQMLQYHGALVVAAASVDDALASGRRTLFDVVVTDIGLPRKPGSWFVADGRYVPRFAGVPVIAVTGRDLAPTLRGMFTAVVEKPIDAAELVTTILRAVNR